MTVAEGRGTAGVVAVFGFIPLVLTFDILRAPWLKTALAVLEGKFEASEGGVRVAERP